MARKNRSKGTQPNRNRTPLAGRRTQTPKSVATVQSKRPLGLTFAPKRIALRRSASPFARSSYEPVPSRVLAPGVVRKKTKNPTLPVVTQKNRKSQLSLAKSTLEPDARKSSERARDYSKCKKRPDSKKAARSAGGGGVKKFIPWC